MDRADAAATEPGFRRTLRIVVGLNLGYFAIQFAVAGAIGSVSLFADSIDFLEDTSINLLILAALGWSPRARARIGLTLAAILLVPALATLWTAWAKFETPVAPPVLPLISAAVGAFVVNLTCALLLVSHRQRAGSLSKAAFLSARNDAFANVAIVLAGVVTAFVWRSAWPDLVVGLAIAVLNADAAHDIWRAARDEGRATRIAFEATDHKRRDMPK